MLVNLRFSTEYVSSWLVEIDSYPGDLIGCCCFIMSKNIIRGNGDFLRHM